VITAGEELVVPKNKNCQKGKFKTTGLFKFIYPA
jgi:hypothetical protein